MKFGRVTSKSISDCSQVYTDLVIGFIFAVSVNNFVYTDFVTIFVTVLCWWPYSSVNIKNLGNHFSLFSYSPFFSKLKNDELPSAVEICNSNFLLFILWLPFNTDV